MRYLIAILCALAVTSAQALYGGAMRPVFALPAFATVGVAGVLGLSGLFRKNGSAPGFSCLTTVLALAGWLLWCEWTALDAGLAAGYLRLTMACLVMYFLFACVITNPLHRLAFVSGLLVLAMGQTAVGIWQTGHAHTGFPLPWFSEQLRLWYALRFGNLAHGFYLNHNHLAWFLNAVWLSALALTCWGRWGVTAKVLCLYAGLMSLAGSILTGSRGGFLSLAAGLGLFCLLSAMALAIGARNKRLGALLALLAGFGMLAGTGWYIYESSHVVQERYNLLLEDSYRSSIIAVVARQFQLEPLQGTGAGTFLYFGRQFRDASNPFDDVYAHNDWAQVTADFGFPALALLLVIVLLHFANGLKSLSEVLRQRMTASSRPQSHAAALMMAALSCLAIFVTHSFFDFNMQIPANALVAAAFLGMLANSGVEAAGSRRSPAGRGNRIAGSLAAAASGAGLLFLVWRAAGPEFYGLKAENALLIGDWEKGSEMAKAGLVAGQAHPGLHAALGESYMLQSLALGTASARWMNYQAAAREFSEAVRLAPMVSAYRLQLARALMEAGRPGRAEEETLEAIRLGPAQLDGYELYGQILERAMRWTEAARAYHISGMRGNPRWGKQFENVERKRRAAETPQG